MRWRARLPRPGGAGGGTRRKRHQVRRFQARPSAHPLAAWVALPTFVNHVQLVHCTCIFMRRCVHVVAAVRVWGAHPRPLQLGPGEVSAALPRMWCSCAHGDANDRVETYERPFGGARVACKFCKISVAAVAVVTQLPRCCVIKWEIKKAISNTVRS